jgi:hypothetical protein
MKKVINFVRIFLLPGLKRPTMWNRKSQHITLITCFIKVRYNISRNSFMVDGTNNSLAVCVLAQTLMGDRKGDVFEGQNRLQSFSC